MSQKFKVKPEQAKILEELEYAIGKELPIEEEIMIFSFGVEVEGDKVVGLGLSNCELTTLLESIVNLKSLKFLNLDRNKFTTLPECVSKFKYLERLKLDNNQLASLSESISTLTSLKELSLINNHLSTLPDSIGNLSSLKKLRLRDNQLKSLPASLYNLTSLQELDLSYNQLTTIYESITGSIDNLTSLKELYLDSNQLTALPESVGNLNALQELNISDNQLTTLPKSICNLISLERFTLGNNKLSSLPECIGNLKSLESLSLGNNQLSSLPESVSNLTTLQTLELYKNKLTDLPESFWKCKDLTIINLKGNPWEGELKEIENKGAKSILDFCRKRASINVFISHAVVDYDLFHIKDISEYLENQDEVYDAYYCEEDLKGDIDDFMNETIPKCQLLLFFASRKSVFNSVDCTHELELARTHKIKIVPIKGGDVNWDDLISIGLGKEPGFDFEGEDFEAFLERLQNYIKEFKQTINLFDAEQARFVKQKMNIKKTLIDFFESEEFEEKSNVNIEELEDLFQKLNYGQLFPLEYFLKCLMILSKKSKHSKNLQNSF